jgi:enoyl-CoA hydratase/carnithine racemase
MTGEFIPAPCAAAMGLINYSLPLEELDAAVDAFAQKLSKGALRAITATKRAVNLGHNSWHRPSWTRASHMNTRLFILKATLKR